MGTCIERLIANDYDEALALLNLSFRNNQPPSFEDSLPKMWKRDDEHMGKHLVCRIDGKMMAIVGIYPLKTKIGNHRFMFSTVGNVATHPDSRMQGFMTELMKAAMGELDKIRADASRLGGLRQRYERYGYEPAGTKHIYTLTSRNIRDYFNNSFKSDITFMPLELGDIVYLSKALHLFSGQLFAVDRTNIEEFYLSAKAWEMTPWAALDENGDMMGYLVASKNRSSLAEQLVCNESRFVEMLCAWIIRNELDNIRLELPPWQPAYCRELGRLSESVSASSASNFKILSWVEITNALLELKANQNKLADGSFILGIEGYGSMILEVKNGKGVCRRVEQKAELLMQPLDATRLLFGHMPPWAATDLSVVDSKLLNSWLPLPLSWNGQDRV